MATIARLLPYELWEIDAVEGWLDDMATQGLIFTHYSGGYYYFREDEPQVLRHRLDLHAPSIDHDRRHEEFGEFGWEHICYINRKTDIYRAAREDAVELNTDEATLRAVLERSQRKLQNTMYICWALSAAILIFTVISIRRFGFFRIPLQEGLLDFLKIILWSVLIVLGDIRLWRSFRDMEKRSLTERSYHTREREAERRKEQRTRTVVCLALLPLVAIPLFVDDYDLRERMEIADTGYERYSIQEILTQDVSLDDSIAICYPHTLSDEYSFYQVLPYGNTYQVNVYEVRSAWLARAYAKEQARIADAEALDVAGHEGVWFYRGTPIGKRHYLDTPDTQNLILLNGDLVAEIEYIGSADLKAAAKTIQEAT